MALNWQTPISWWKRAGRFLLDRVNCLRSQRSAETVDRPAVDQKQKSGGSAAAAIATGQFLKRAFHDLQTSLFTLATLTGGLALLLMLGWQVSQAVSEGSAPARMELNQSDETDLSQLENAATPAETGKKPLPGKSDFVKVTVTEPSRPPGAAQTFSPEPAQRPDINRDPFAAPPAKHVVTSGTEPKPGGETEGGPFARKAEENPPQTKKMAGPTFAGGPPAEAPDSKKPDDPGRLPFAAPPAERLPQFNKRELSSESKDEEPLDFGTPPPAAEKQVQNPKTGGVAGVGAKPLFTESRRPDDPRHRGFPAVQPRPPGIGFEKASEPTKTDAAPIVANSEPALGLEVVRASVSQRPEPEDRFLATSIKPTPATPGLPPLEKTPADTIPVIDGWKAARAAKEPPTILRTDHGRIAPSAIPLTSSANARWTVAAPKLKLEILLPSRITAGARVRIRLRIVNVGPVAAEQVTLHVDLPAELKYHLGRRLSLDIGKLSPGGFQEARLTPVAVRSGDASVSATVFCKEARASRVATGAILQERPAGANPMPAKRKTVARMPMAARQSTDPCRRTR